MKITAIVSAIMAMSLAMGGCAFAQEHNDRGDRNERGRYEHSQRGYQQDRRDNTERRQDWHDHSRGYHDQQRGAGPNHTYYRGDRMPDEYRHRQYVVDDWRGHHLSAPPRGYQWVQTGRDYVLITIATGIIAQLFLNN